MSAPGENRPVVLIVDDNPDVRLGYQCVLEATGQFEVLDAWSAADALKCLARNRVDVVVTDLYMPGELDGIDLVLEISRAPVPHPAVIAMSGSPHLAYRTSLQTARHVGADATLTKPFSGDALVRAIRAVMREAR